MSYTRTSNDGVGSRVFLFVFQSKERKHFTEYDTIRYDSIQYNTIQYKYISRQTSLEEANEPVMDSNFICEGLLLSNM